MITKEIADRIYVWKNNPAWYRPVNNGYVVRAYRPSTRKQREKATLNIKRLSTKSLLLMALRLMTG